MARSRFRVLLGGVLLVGLAGLSGCSSGSNKVPVTGTVLVDGNPGSLTILTFWSEDPNAPPGGTGRVVADDKGEFSIGEQGKDTGLPPANYKITFSRFLDKNGKPVFGGGKKSEAAYEVPSKESMPEQYRDRSKTPFSVEVSRTSNTFRLEVSTKSQ
jgi:hypothetical protein